jgi:hypothetical protein
MQMDYAFSGLVDSRPRLGAPKLGRRILTAATAILLLSTESAGTLVATQHA